MNIIDFPSSFLIGNTIHLGFPDLSRATEMHDLINQFGDLHFKFLSWVQNEITSDETQRNMQAALENFVNDKNEYKFLILGNNNSKLLGCISLFIRNPKIPHYEIGYWLSSEAMGKGSAAQACILVRDIAQKILGAKRLEIRTSSRNVRSIQVALRSGFQHEATLANERINEYGELDDTCIYSYIERSL